MKRNNFLILLIISWINFAHAGGVDGGGGKSIVCRNLDDSIKTAEVLDLYEARVQYGRTISINESPYMDQATTVLNRLGSGRGKKFTDALLASAKFIDKTKRILPDDIELKTIDDSFEVFIPKNCKAEQLVNFLGSNQILFNGEIWNHLNETNKAAIIVHEALYNEFRLEAHATNSVHVRKAVGAGFEGINLELVNADVPSNAIKCEAYLQDNEDLDVFYPVSYWIYQDVQNPKFNVVQFDELDGILMLTKTSFKAAANFMKFGVFSGYSSTIFDSKLEKGIWINFRDIQSVSNDKVLSLRYVGVSSNSSAKPLVATRCNF